MSKKVVKLWMVHARLPTLENFNRMSNTMLEHIGRLARMSALDTEVDGSNPGSSMLFP